jgi:hypothetical protein
MLKPPGMNRTVLITLVGWGLLASGCVSTGMARTLDPGHFQVTLTPGVQGIAHVDSKGVHVSSTNYLPQLELGARYGVTPRMDLGARLFLLGAEADARFALLRAPSMKSGVDLTFAPAVGVSVIQGWLPHVQLPLLLGVNLGGSQLVLGPRVGLLGLAPFIGTSLGWAIPLGGSFRVMPELTLVQPITSEPAGLSSFFQGGIGLVFGGYEAE